MRIERQKLDPNDRRFRLVDLTMINNLFHLRLTWAGYSDEITGLTRIIEDVPHSTNVKAFRLIIDTPEHYAEKRFETAARIINQSVVADELIDTTLNSIVRWVICEYKEANKCRLESIRNKQDEFFA